jgi:flagellar biosynthesis/type III secretory pathway protein FliH
MTLAEMFRQEGKEEGIKQGIEKGIEKGIQQGEHRKNLNYAIKLSRFIRMKVYWFIYILYIRYIY